MELELSECTQKHIDLIYNMANDIETRKNSFNTSAIKYDEHCKWYKDSLNNPNRYMYVVKDKDIIVGYIRLDIDKKKGEISYSIEKSFRGKGYANELLNIIKSKAEEIGLEVLEGKVKPENIFSRKTFIYNKFIEYKEEGYFKYVFFLKGDKNEDN